MLNCLQTDWGKSSWKVIVVLVVVSCVVQVEAANKKRSEKPNIVLVMADDQGWGDMAYNGHPVIKTPHFDAAAAAGLKFSRFYAAAPVCSPTRASVLTGRHPNRAHVLSWGHPMRPQEKTIAEAVKKVGYTTGHFGKWHLGSVRSKSPVNPGAQGFDEWISAPNFYDNNPVLSHQGTAVAYQGESSVVTADLAMDWIKKQAEQEEPFLAVVWFGSPHKPHTASKEDQALYVDQPKNLKNFYGEVTGMDRAFGKIRTGLKELGIRDNTILWYCSDNGALPKVGSPGNHRGFKGAIYEGGLLVPAIMEWPTKIPTPKTVDTRCNTCDIYPTVLQLTGATVKNPLSLDGIDLTTLITTEKNTTRAQPMGFWQHPQRGIITPSDKLMRELLAAQENGQDLPPHASSLNAEATPQTPHVDHEFPGHAAWIAGDWKLHRIRNKQKQVRWELYNLAEDPAEKNNVITQEAARLPALKSDLEAWLQSVVNSMNGEDYTQK